MTQIAIPSARTARAARLLAALLASAAPAPACAAAFADGHVRGAEARAVAGDFESALAPWGEWMALGGGLRAWRPEGVDADWRPYRDGHWSWTSEGWFWVSAEPWAWATYHYGRWRFDRSRGWVWLPGGAWVPARVVWRLGAEVVGWAPATDDGFLLAAHWSFLPAGAFVDADAAREGLAPARIPALLARTRTAGSAGPPLASVGASRAAPATARRVDRAPAPAPRAAKPVPAKLAATPRPPFATAN